MFGLRFLRPILGLGRVPLRTFMSPGFACNEAWEKRLKSKLLERVNLEEMYLELENRFGQRGSVTAVDMDIFSNAVNGSHVQELEDLMHKFRLCGEASNILPSTHHAFIRALSSFGDADNLLRILDDRLNYGIFPDNFCSLFLMDGFIKKGDFKNAAKVAVLQMLQEDEGNPLINSLSLYSCHKYLLEPTEWEEKVVEDEKADDGEEVRVRVKYLRNPFFDDHFDLRNPNSLIGKTLLHLGHLLNDSSHQILGAVLYSKYDLAQQLINKALEDKQEIYESCLNLALESLKKVEIKEGEEQKETQDKIASLASAIENLKSNTTILNDDPIIKMEETIKRLVSQTEPELIAKQKEIYDNWESAREEALMEEVKEAKRLERIEEIERKKQELAEKEQLLFFFENEDKMDLEIENKRVPYPKKWLGHKKKKRTDSLEYIPPEIVKQRTTPL